ncbi:MAG TPA: DUF1674 domain-containing protein [Gammaproteobacteria bacterium]|jgi:hypothetical protein|nr:DUF1674 domain-containing protein [Gammaproteobacteria bacterium]
MVDERGQERVAEVSAPSRKPHDAPVPPAEPAAAARPANLQPLREIGGPKGPEPTRYGDWERAGRCIDF